MLRVLTDLYVQKPSHSAEEEAQYVELALGLIDAVDAPTRGTVAASLSNYPGAPATSCASWRACLWRARAAATPKPYDLIELFFAAERKSAG